MKIIYKIDSDDMKKIEFFRKLTNTDECIVIPQTEEIKTFVISDDGNKVTEI